MKILKNKIVQTVSAIMFIAIIGVAIYTFNDYKVKADDTVDMGLFNTKIAELQEQIDNLTTEINTLKEENTKLNTELTNLKETDSNLKNNIKKCSDDIKEIKPNVNKLNEFYNKSKEIYTNYRMPELAQVQFRLYFQN